MISPAVSSTEQVYHSLREDIVSGKLTPGEKLVTERLATTYGVSRTPVREAIQRLERDRLVKIEPNCGAIIRKMPLDEACDWYMVRALLEEMAVRKMMEKPVSPEIIKRLRQYCADHHTATTLAERVNNDRNFHETIYRAANSNVLTELLDNQRIMLSSFTGSVMTMRTLSHDGKVDTEHEQIVQAIEAGDCERAARLTRKHLESASEFLKKMNRSID